MISFVFWLMAVASASFAMGFMFGIYTAKNVQNAKLDGKINELEAKLAKRPVVLYAGNRAYTYETYTGQQS